MAGFASRSAAYASRSIVRHGLGIETSISVSYLVARKLSAVVLRLTCGSSFHSGTRLTALRWYWREEQGLSVEPGCRVRLAHSRAARKGVVTMKTHRALVDEVLVLLRQARTEIAEDLDRGLADSLDKAIGILESTDVEMNRGGNFMKALEVLSKGLATIETIRRLIGGR